jgi:hypothetical protein
MKNPLVRLLWVWFVEPSQEGAQFNREMGEYIRNSLHGTILGFKLVYH